MIPRASFFLRLLEKPQEPNTAVMNSTYYQTSTVPVQLPEKCLGSCCPSRKSKLNV